MPERGELIVHAGFAKTGSSALQFWLDQNADALAEAGVRYPREGISAAEAPGGITSGNGKSLAQFLVRRLREPGFERRVFRKEFREKFLPAPGERVLVSREQIRSFDPELLRRFKDQIIPEVRLTFVLFIRDIYGSIRARWMQAVKRAAWTESLEKEIASFQLNTPDRLKDLVAVLGPENVRLLHYDSVAGDVVGAFLKTIGLEGAFSGKVARAPLVNRSLTDAEARVLMECSAIHRRKDASQRISDHFMEHYPDRAVAHIPDPAVITALNERFADEIRWVNDNFFEGRDVFSAGRVGAPSGPARDASDVSDDQVWREVALFLVEKLAVRLERLDSKRPVRRKQNLV
ncbi:MAG: hypothetical protein H7X93_11835 [Sphingomonadaceae bacterium]|nr:hypothetical protein [Sphingomonadaceae bacterium]